MFSKGMEGDIEKVEQTTEERVERDDDENLQTTPEDLWVEEDNEQAAKTTLWQKIKKNKKKLFLFLLFLVKESVDCALDWLLYQQLSAIEEGLVYGPVDCRVLQSLLIFSITGTILAAIDLANRVWDICTGHPFVDSFFPEICVMFLEDIPQMLIAYVIIRTRGGEEGVFPLIKAIIIMLGALGAASFFFILLLETCNGNVVMNLRNVNKKKTALRSGGLSIIFSLAYLIVVSSVQSNLKYFSRVGIYCGTSDAQFPFDDIKNITWMKLFDVDDIRSEITAEIRMNMSDLQVNVFCSGCQSNYSSSTKYFKGDVDYTLFGRSIFRFQFKYLPPSTRYILGDIHYNIMKTEIDSCDRMSLKRVPPLRFFKANITRNQNVTDNDLVRNIYNVDDDLIDIKQVWTTGIFRIPYSGNGSPHFNPDIVVPCYL